MLRFLIKKSFFDAWDNLLTLIILNLGFLLCFASVVFLPFLTKPTSPLMIILAAIPGILLSHVYTGLVSTLMHRIADYGSFNLSLVVPGLKKTWKSSIIFASINIIILLIVSVSIPFYFSMSNILAYAGGILVFWLSFIWVLSTQYFYPVLLQMKGSLPKSFKRALLIVLDNPGTTFFVFILSIFILLISFITALLMPGVSAVLLLHQNTLKLRLYKYDWLEENPDANKKKIPWPELLEDDKEKMGPRSFKGMIFPWKD